MYLPATKSETLPESYRIRGNQTIIIFDEINVFYLQTKKK